MKRLRERNFFEKQSSRRCESKGGMPNDVAGNFSIIDADRHRGSRFDRRDAEGHAVHREQAKQKRLTATVVQTQTANLF